MGVPQGRWMVYVMEIPNLKWMRTGGTPISGTPHKSSLDLTMFIPFPWLKAMASSGNSATERQGRTWQRSHCWNPLPVEDLNWRRVWDTATSLRATNSGKLSICLSVYLSIYLSVCLSICLYICLAVYLSMNLFRWTKIMIHNIEEKQDSWL